MRRRLSWLALLSAATVITALYLAKKVHATPADGFVGTTLALGRFGVIDVTNVSVPANTSTPGRSLLSSLLELLRPTMGTIQTANRTSTPQAMGFVDPGGHHVHIIHNEGSEVAQTIAVQTIPANGTRRIDANDPGNCHFQ